MKIALNVIKWIAGVLLGIIIVIGLCWWLIPDEELNPEAGKFVAQAPVPPAEKNGYFMIWGLVASPELDPHKVGQQIVAAHDRIIASEKDLSRFNVEPFYGDNPLKFPKDSKRLCDAEKENCLQVYLAKRADVEAQAEEYKIYLARYRKIRDYEDFGSAMSQQNYQTPVPSWQPLLRMSDLVDGAIAQRVSIKSSQEAALEELAAEINSWRRLLQSNDWLITQMISVVTLHRKYQLASAIMNAYPEAVAAYPVVFAKITTPLLPGKTNIQSSMRSEARSSLALYQDLHQQERFLPDTAFEGMPGLPLRLALVTGGYRPNASINQSYIAFKVADDILSKSPKEMVDGRQAMLERQERVNALSIGAIFFNPVGRVLNGVAYPDYSNYAFRIDDLIGLSRLVDLQRRIIEGNIALDKIGATLASVGLSLTDPYTEKPMHWDAATKRVSFVLYGKRFANFGYVTLEHFK